MPAPDQFEEISTQLILVLPDLRRYARGLAGTQGVGDRYAEAALELLTEFPTLLSDSSSLRVGLFAAFHKVWVDEGRQVALSDKPKDSRGPVNLASLTPLSREVLLLYAVEDFKLPQISEIIARPEAEVTQLLEIAHQEMRHAVTGRVLVIEDEPLIAMDLQDILEGLGHDVIGAAATHQQAVSLAKGQEPDLILSDIQLADGSSGIDAVQDILAAAGEVPVIFITAYPERLLTGAGQEPTFVIPKPYNDLKVMSSVSQALFFADAAVAGAS